MSLSAIVGSATSGLFAAQNQLRLVSDNISNVNTPGYARKTLQQTSVTLSAMGGGVETGRVTRAVDHFLSQASYLASAQAGEATVVSNILDRAQGLFGDPSADYGYFNQLDLAFAAFASSAQDPASTVGRNQAINAITSFLDQSSGISQELTRLGQEAGRRIGEGVTKINTLLQQIDDLNKEIIRGGSANGDTSGAENTQAQLIDDLSQMIDVVVSPRTGGGVDIRAGRASLLAGRSGPAKVSFTAIGTAPGQLMVTSPGGAPQSMQPNAGALKGLIDIRNHELPSIASQLGEFVTRAADEINRAHNASSAVPPPNILAGRNTGLDLATAASGFTGRTTVAIVDSAGVMQTRVDIDFDAGTMSADFGPTVGFTPATFVAALNGRLGGNGAASFSGGALRIQASAGDGVSIADDATSPSLKAGRGFSHFFGLNDLVTSGGYPYPATGMTTTDQHGFTPGGVVTLRLQDSSGLALRDVAVTVPAAPTMADLIGSLNSSATGVGLYGAFSLDADGRLAFAASTPGVGVGVVSDTSERGAGGPTVTQLFGLNPLMREQRASAFSVRADIASDSTKLSLAQLDLSAGPGSSALSRGDARGALRLAAAGETAAVFDPAGTLGSLSATLSQYGAQMSGSVAQRANAAGQAKANSEAVSAEVSTRRSSVEGVNLDEELIRLTTYQQSYNASARMLQAVSELYDILLKIA